MKPVCIAIIGCLCWLQAVSVQALTQTTPLLELTLLPNYLTGQADAIGFYQDIYEAPACESEKYWFDPGYSQRYFSAEDGVCIYYVWGLGQVAPTADGDAVYSVQLPDALSQRPDVHLAVVAADVQPNGRLTSVPGTFWTWAVNPAPESLTITIIPWTIATRLTVTPILQQLQPYIQAQALLNGTTTLSQISTDRTYGILVNRYAFPDRSRLFIADLLMTYLDFPAKTFADSYPGLKGLNETGRQQTGIILETTISEHSSALADSETGNSVTARVLGFQPKESAVFDALCPSATEPDSAANIEMLALCVMLGPTDQLTLDFPGFRIVSASPPANQQPAPDTVIYSGPGRFQLKIGYERLPSSFIEQMPYIARGVAGDLAGNWLAMAVTQNRLLMFLIAITVTLAVIIIRVGLGAVTQVAHRPIVSALRWLLSYFRYLVLGALLIFWTPAASSLILLSIVMLAPHLKRALRLEKWAVIIIIGIVIADNVAALPFASSDFAYLRSSWLAVTAVLLVVLLGYFFRQQTPHYTRIPAAMLLFFTLATYDVIARSLPALAVLLALAFLFTIRSRHLIQAGTEPSLSIQQALRNLIEGLRNLVSRQASIPLSLPDESFTAIALRQLRRAEQGSTIEVPSATTQYLPETDDKDSRNPLTEPITVANWSRYLRTVATEPLVIITIFFVAIVFISASNVPTFYDIWVNFLTITAIALLFACIYDLFKIGNWEPPVYIKAGIFMFLLLIVFFTGIGSAEVPFRAGGETISFALFMGKQAELLAGRVIFYLSIPLLIGVFIEYRKARYDTKDLNLVKFIADYRPIISVVGALIAILAPRFSSLITQQQTLITLNDLLDQILKFPTP